MKNQIGVFNQPLEVLLDDEYLKTLSKEGHVVLVETFADKIADIALDDERVTSAAIHVEKLDIFSDCEAVGATIKKSRNEIS